MMSRGYSTPSCLSKLENLFLLTNGPEGGRTLSAFEGVETHDEGRVIREEVGVTFVVSGVIAFLIKIA
jgi:hypothetical protein